MSHLWLPSYYLVESVVMANVGFFGPIRLDIGFVIGVINIMCFRPA